MSKIISIEKFERKVAEVKNFAIEDAVSIILSRTERAMYINGKRCRIDNQLLLSITPEGRIDRINPDNFSVVVKPKYDKDFTAFCLFEDDIYKFNWKHPYDLSHILVGVFKNDDIVVYITLSAPPSSGNLSGIFLDIGYKGGYSYQKVLELISSELSMVTTLSKTTDQYAFSNLLKADPLPSIIDADYTVKEGDEDED